MSLQQRKLGARHKSNHTYYVVRVGMQEEVLAYTVIWEGKKRQHLKIPWAIPAG